MRAEGVGLEPTSDRMARNGFRDRPGRGKVPANRNFGRAEGTREGTKSTNPSTGARGGRWERRHRNSTPGTPRALFGLRPPLPSSPARSCTGPRVRPSIRVDPFAAAGSAFSMKARKASCRPPRRASFAATGGACCSRRRSRRASSPKELWTLAGEREQASPRSTQGGEPCRTPWTSQAGGGRRRPSRNTWRADRRRTRGAVIPPTRPGWRRSWR